MMTGRWLFFAGMAAVVLIGTGLAMVWGFSGNTAFASHPNHTAPTAEQRSDDFAETVKYLKVTQQETIDQLQVVQDLVASQQAEMKKLSDQVVALTAELNSLKQTPPIGLSLVSPKAALSKSR
jgi:uncharacterized coiled-coil protein SlyX